MGQIIHCWGAARDPNIHNLFQIADVVAGVIRRINADLVLPLNFFKITILLMKPATQL